jgi:hypothetical protein
MKADAGLKSVEEATRAAGGWLPSLEFQWVAGLVTAAGVLLYLLLRAMASQFYTPLGLDLDDVGLSQVPLLARSAFGLFFVTAFYGSAWLTLVVAVRFAPPTWTSPGVGRMLIGGLMWLAAVALSTWLAMAGTGLADVVSLLLATNATLAWLGSLARHLFEDHVWRYRIGSALALIVFGGYGLWSLFAVARDDADEVLAGKAPAEQIERVSLMPYRASVAYINDPPSSSTRRRCVIYLGESPTAVVVYDPIAERTKLLDTGTQIAVDPYATRGCATGHGKP